MFRNACLLIALAAAGSFSPAVNGQATGTIHGTVFDNSGAVVAGAQVTAISSQTNQPRITTTNPDGGYILPLLPAGDYAVRVTSPGLAPFVQKNITLQANTDIEVDAKLAVATATETVNVSDTPLMVQTSATNLVQVVDQKRIVDLPLNGRNVLQLMALNSGVADRGAAGGTIQVNTFASGQYHFSASLNGSRGNATNFLLDDADNNDDFTKIAHPYPNPDAVSEVSVQSSTFDAQYGRGVGGVVNVVTRSGSNQIHGSAFEFLRNYELNAANFFSGRDALKRNQFGFSAGGPVIIPKLYNGKDHTFIFGSYQGTRNRSATPGALATTPSSAMKQGDLSSFLRPDGVGAIHDPLSGGGYFPNNQIPVSRFDPVSAKLLNVMPASSSANFQLRFGTPTLAISDDQLVLRGDQIVNEKQRVSVRYFLLHYNQPWVFLPNNLYSVAAGQYGNAQNVTVSHTYVFSSRLLNQFNGTYNKSTPTAAPPADLTTNYQSLGANVKTAPGFPTMDLSISNWSGISLGLGYGNHQNAWELADNLSYTAGKQSMKIGFNFKRHLLDKSSYFLTGGTASFSGLILSDAGKSNAGNSFGEFLLGKPNTWQQQSAWSENLYNNFFTLYFQDDIRVNRKLTVNLGMRWEPSFDATESSGKRVTFVPGQQSTVFPNAFRGLLFQGDAGYEDRIVPTEWGILAPRIGFAFQALSKTVIRSAYGIFYDHNPGIFNNRSASAAPFIKQIILTAPDSLANPYGSSPVLDPSAQSATRDFVFAPFVTYAVPSRQMGTGYMQNWNFVVEHQLRPDMLVRGAYVGSKGTHLLNSPEVNPAIYGPGATVANQNARRVYQPIGPIELGASVGWSKYHAAQFTFQQRFSKGVTVLANYTISKSSDLSSYGSVEGNTLGPNPFNYNDNRGKSDFDIPQRLVVSGIWQLPAFKDRGLLMRSVLGGWQSNYIFTAQSGVPMTIFSGVDNALMGVGGNFADLTGVDWRLPPDRPKRDRIRQNFNTAAFRVNAVGTIGTGRRNQLRAPGLWNADFSAFKDFGIWERVRLQFRGELFNVLNHANLNTPNTTVTSPSFGQVTSASSPRIVQFGLKLLF
ncbi:MAG TPA: carboxypeptidase-like regulatory domain-containing protein [Bryobacteraceae bacterium]|nr:carboxypeptidase-like regulatory domain-containing protein [Bryobacteraceae bacterium]